MARWRLLRAALALVAPAQTLCFVGSFVRPSPHAASLPRLRPARGAVLGLAPAMLRAGSWCRAPGAAELTKSRWRRSRAGGKQPGAPLTSLNVKKGKGTTPNNKAKKGREAYLAAKRKLESQQAASDEQPRPEDADAWTMEEAWLEHTQAIDKVMTEAAPDFAAGPAVVEVALGAPEKWWDEVVVPRLRRIASAAYDGLSVQTARGVRVVDVGTGTGTMLPLLSGSMPAGVEGTVVAVDVCEAMLDIVQDRFPSIPLLQADFSSINPRDLHPIFQSLEGGQDAGETAEQTDAELAASGGGKVDVVVMNSVYSIMLDEVGTLEAASRVLRRDGRLVLSHPLGREFVTNLQQQVPDLIQHVMPDAGHLDELIKFLPLRRRGDVVDEEELYMAVLERTPEQLLPTVLCMRGPVASGWGRGGKKLGVPTANLPESLFPAELRDVPTGVYVGWAAVEDGGEAIKAVVNVGYSPTFVGAENPEKVVEAHLFADFAEDFYDKEMRLILCGYLRPEAKFGAFPLLLAAIQQDLADAKACLDQPRFAALSRHPFLQPASGAEPWAESSYDAAVAAAAPPP